MQTKAITTAITTISEAEEGFNLQRTEQEEFFPEWHHNLPLTCSFL